MADDQANNIVDLTNDSQEDSSTSSSSSSSSSRGSSSNSCKRQKVDPGTKVWVVIHQCESEYGQIGCEESFRYCSHQPTTFDSKIKGIFTTLEKANSCALEIALGMGFEEEEEDDNRQRRG
jgi:hypothetical protein